MSHPEDVRKAVREHYRRIALDAEGSTSSCCDDGNCGCDNSALYQVDVSGLPQQVTGLSLGSGDPITLANLKPGQTVLDLGSGGGIDCFLAAERVGLDGLVIGVDMTAEMIQKAERNKFATGHKNVEFRLGQIEALPVDSDSVDVIISNCVINLSPDKAAVFQEAFRVLRPGGLLAVSDMVTQGRFTADQRSDLDSWAECVAGAEDVSEFVALLRQAGFTAITLSDSGNLELDLLQSAGLYIGPPRLFSARVTAIKPVSAAGQRQ